MYTYIVYIYNIIYVYIQRVKKRNLFTICGADLYCWFTGPSSPVGSALGTERKTGKKYEEKNKLFSLDFFGGLSEKKGPKMFILCVFHSTAIWAGYPWSPNWDNCGRLGLPLHTFHVTMTWRPCQDPSCALEHSPSQSVELPRTPATCQNGSYSVVLEKTLGKICLRQLGWWFSIYGKI